MYGIESPFENVQDRSTFKLFGSKINLIGGDKPSKFLGAGCDYLFINEAIPNVQKKLFDQAEQRCRKFWWIDSNPSAFDHWVLDLPKRDDVSVYPIESLSHVLTKSILFESVLSVDASTEIFPLASTEKAKFIG